MRAELFEHKEVYVRCPECGDAMSHRVTDVSSGDSFEPSFCRKCGVGITGRCTGDGFEIERTGERKCPTFILLRLAPQSEPVFVIVRGSKFVTDDDPPSEDEMTRDFFKTDEFIYEHQVRPGVYLRGFVAVAREEDAKCYRLFRYVGTRSAPRRYEEGESEEEVALRIFGELL